MVVIKPYLVMGLLVDVSLTNLVSNSGVVSADVTGVGTARRAISSNYLWNRQSNIWLWL
jgi:hypothetical protein